MKKFAFQKDLEYSFVALTDLELTCLRMLVMDLSSDFDIDAKQKIEILKFLKLLLPVK